MKRLPWPGILACALLFSVLLFPGTGWLARLHAGALFRGPEHFCALFRDLGIKEAPIDYSGEVFRARHHAYAAARPRDFAARLALAVRLERGGQPEILLRLREMRASFSDRSALYAHILRHAWHEVRLRRDEEYLVKGETPPSRSSDKPPSPDRLAEFDRDAAAGERLDPDNAYFPLMRAVGLFGARRDQDAIATIKRAARKPRWDDYTGEDARARLRVDEMLLGPLPAAHKLAIHWTVLFPHFERLRAAASIATYKAAELERAGRRTEGLEIRMALVECGEKIRAQSDYGIGTQLGISIASVAASRPGGAPAVLKPYEVEEDAWMRHQCETFASYLIRSEREQEARDILVASAANMEAADIIRAGSRASPLGGEAMAALTRSWAVCLFALCSAVWFLLMGGLFATLSLVFADRKPIVIVVLVAGLFGLGIMSRFAGEWVASVALVMDRAPIWYREAGVSPFGLRAATAVSALLLPMLVSVAATVRSFLARRPPAITLSRWMFAASLVMLLVYVFAAGSTAQQESRVSAALASSLSGEGRYYAEVIGQKWSE